MSSCLPPLHAQSKAWRSRTLVAQAKQNGYCGAQKRWKHHLKKVSSDVLDDVNSFCQAISGAPRVRMRISRNCCSDAKGVVALRARRRLGVKIWKKKKGARGSRAHFVTPVQSLAIGRERQTSITAIANAFQISHRQAGREMKVHAAMVVELQVVLLTRLCEWLEAARPLLELGLVSKCYDGASHRVRGFMQQAGTQASNFESQRQATVDIEATEVPL